MVTKGKNIDVVYDTISAQVSLEAKKLIKDFVRKERTTISQLILGLLEEKMNLPESSLSPRNN